MAIEHILTESDSLHSLAEQYLGDPNRWGEIVEYNGLSSPYIVQTAEEKNNNFGSGYVLVQRATATRAITIPKGWKIHTQPSLIGGMVKTYVVTEQTTLPAGQSFGYIHVTCTVPGSFGNIPHNTVMEAGKEFEEAGIRFVTMTNDSAFTGGRDTHVLTIGDSLFIPTSETQFLPPKSLREMGELIGDEDLGLFPEFGYQRATAEDNFGDIASVSGLENIIQAVNDRLMTEKGDLPLHPTYGTNLPSLIGTAMKPYTKKMVELEIYEALSYEDRIENVRITSLDIVQTTINVELRFNPAGMSKETTTRLSLNYSNSRGGNMSVRA